MITDAILKMIETVLVWIGGLLPDWDLSEAWSGWAGFVGNITAMNYFLPLQEVWSVTVAAFLLFPLFMGVTLAVWLLAMLRGGSARA